MSGESASKDSASERFSYIQRDEIDKVNELFINRVVEEKKCAAFVLRGQKGIGKTRFIHEFVGHLIEIPEFRTKGIEFNKDTDFFVHSCQQSESSKYAPFIDIKQSIEDDMAKKTVLVRFMFVIFSFFQIYDVIDALKKFSSAFRGKYFNDEQVQLSRKEGKLFQKYLKAFKNRTKRRPVVIYIQNVQWLDNYSMILIRALIEQELWGMIVLEEDDSDFINKDTREKINKLVKQEKILPIILKPLPRGFEKEVLESYFCPDLFSVSELDFIYTLSDGCPGKLKRLVEDWEKRALIFKQGPVYNKVPDFRDQIRPPVDQMMDLVISSLQDGIIQEREKYLIERYANNLGISSETVSNMIHIVKESKKLGYEIKNNVPGFLSDQAFLAQQDNGDKSIIEFIPIKDVEHTIININDIHDDHIINSRDITVTDKGILVIYDFFNGVPLQEWYKKIYDSRILEILESAQQILQGLAILHEKGYIHGYINPSSIARTSEGIYCLLGLDLSKSSISELSQKRDFIHYLSPEQIDNNKPNKTSDVFSFGVILYEWLTKSLPFPGHNRKEIKRSYKQVLFDRETSIAKPLQTFLEKCLQIEPSSRYSDAGEVKKELEGLIESIKYRINEDSVEDYCHDQQIPVSTALKRLNDAGIQVAEDDLIQSVLDNYRISKNKLEQIMLKAEHDNHEKKRPPIAYAAAFLFIIALLAGLEIWGRSAETVPETIVIDKVSVKSPEKTTLDADADELEYLFMDELSQSSNLNVLTPEEFVIRYGRKKYPAFNIKAQVKSSSVDKTLIFQFQSYRNARPFLWVKRYDEEKTHFSYAHASNLLTGGIRNLVLDALQKRDIPTRTSTTFTQSWDAFDSFYQGEQAWNKLNVTQAHNFYSTALEIDDSFVLAKLRLAQVLRFQGSTSSAQSYIRDIDSSLSQLSRMDSLKARALQARLNGDLRGEIDILLKIYNECPTRKETSFDVAEAYYELCDVSSAIRFYQRSLEIDSLFGRAHNHLAYCYSHLGDHKNALKHFKIYLELDKTANAWDSMGDGYMAAGKLDSAAGAKLRGIELDPQLSYLYGSLSYIYLRMGDYQQALDCAQDYIEYSLTDDNKASGFFRKAIIYFHMNQLDSAIMFCDSSLETSDADDIVSRNNDAHWLRGVLYFNMEQYARARQELYDFQELVEAYDINATNYRMNLFKYMLHLKALLCVHENDYEGLFQCIAFFDSQIKTKVKDHTSPFDLAFFNTFFGKIFLEIERTNLARKRFEMALDYNPNYALAHYYLSRVYEHTGDAENQQKCDDRFQELWTADAARAKLVDL